MMRDKVNVSEKFELVRELWSPRIVGEVNRTHIKLARIEGEFDWHRHEDSDELFWVHRGRLRLQVRGREDIWLEEGELFVVPRGVEHRPVAPGEVELILVEAAGTVNTGDAPSERTAAEQWI